MSNSGEIGGSNRHRDLPFAEPWLGATLMEFVTYIAEFSEVGIEYVASGTEEWPRDGLIVLFAHGLMLNAVSAGALGVRGSQLPDPTAKDIPIEVLRSERLSFDFETDNGRGSLSLNGTYWHYLRFDVEQIKKIWPKPAPPGKQFQKLANIGRAIAKKVSNLLINETKTQAPAVESTQRNIAEQQVASDSSRGVVPAPAKSSARRRPGRKKGTGSYEKKDKPLLIEMASLINSDQATSPHDAARQVAPKAFGAGTVESKRDRLYKRFREQDH